MGARCYHGSRDGPVTAIRGVLSGNSMAPVIHRAGPWLRPRRTEYPSAAPSAACPQVPLMQQLAETARRFSALAPAADYWSIRLVADESEHLEVRQGVAEPCALSLGRGAMVTVVRGGGVGYAATSDLSDAGLAAAARRAADWAEAHARLGLFDAALYPRSDAAPGLPGPGGRALGVHRRGRQARPAPGGLRCTGDRRPHPGLVRLAGSLAGRAAPGHQRRGPHRPGLGVHGAGVDGGGQ